jgi:hypothetical protein
MDSIGSGSSKLCCKFLPLNLRQPVRCHVILRLLAVVMAEREGFEPSVEVLAPTTV